jgi:hypothetical protein
MMEVLLFLYNIAQVVVFSYILLLVTWLFFVAIMHLRIVKDSLHPFAKVNAYILLGIGYPLDAACNLLVSIFLLDMPQEWLLTDKLKRLKRKGKWWQKVIAWWICEHLLNPFDKGHC